MYFARIHIQKPGHIYNGKEIPVISKARKTTGFKTEALATKAIERKAKAGFWGQGRIYESNNGERILIKTIAV